MKIRTKPGGGGGGGGGAGGGVPLPHEFEAQKALCVQSIYARKVTKTDARFKDSKTLISILFLK